ncbi:MAG: oxygen-independent coproporphyrinogen III oxidase [Rhodospirillales bacterium]|nr:oxygen-independent coproporphyrinogen III oxidase [Rhodospirillales bacterium]
MSRRVDGGKSGGMDEKGLVARYAGRLPRYTSYPTAPNFTEAVTGETYLEWLGALAEGASLSLYLHVPFCDRLCLYCGCTTQVVRQDAPRRAYAKELGRELCLVAGAIGRRAAVSHIHWGGGTPSTLPADCLVAIMDLIRTLFAVESGAEVAIELDPTAVPEDRMAALPRMGITRASLGVQDFDAAVQKAIGREQSYEETAACAEGLRKIGVRSLNLDLMYGLPHQTEESVARTAREVLGLEADRLAVFGYAHVPWMKRHQALLPEAALPGPEARFGQRGAVDRVLCEEGGYRAVGLDHYARPGDAMALAAADGRLGRGFQGYTTDRAEVLIGIGASAIGSLPQGYVQNAAVTPAWLKAIRAGRPATVRGVALTEEDRLRRDVIERIMCELAADLPALAAAHEAEAGPLLAAAAPLAGFAEDGLVRWDGRRLKVTEKGRPFVRNVAALFDAYLARGEGVRHSLAV